ncbi:PREDICTED: histone-lysine N-methyltransferase, H3 lysine-79 specific isoform X2 [Acromyrmex echinatior]|uniref:histone-lysine N-methyltransferase, H3 lysine-79 specific isoform X2 n=1 Tax=Acromyrmex echinatior TaxID=103372 RepID=UPI000580F64E|nr:PREDICTED: histone-lysine N-methyltransferase, H3 lysine-79 specific isoform X2 [Acromyrmex echinatior]
MFSELCRETLRKAAVCYSARAGSPSPSPPTSPPPSPAKEAKTAANADLANVRDAIHEGVRDHQHHHHHSGTTTAGKRTSPTGNTTSESGQRDPASERSASDRPTDRPNDFREKRPAMPTDFSKRLPGLEAREGRRSGTCGTTEFRESRSVSPEKGTGRQHEDHRGGGGSAGNECGRSDTRISRRSSGSSPEPEDNSSTSGDEAGAAPEETNQRSSSAHNRHSLTKEQTMHWFAQIGGDDSLSLTDVKRPRSLYDEDSLDGDRPYDNEGRESTGSSKELDRAKLVRERQNEERQRKLEELRQQALAAQRFREQREEERRRRIDELRSRDNDRRNQVEERKRLICEAERERREAILRKNQEREARIEAKKRNERSHIVFAFGSSTPRMLEPADTGGSTFWGTRRATSTTNVMMFSAAQPLTRRSSERELDGSKKRATSAGGLDRKPGEDMRMSSSMYEVFNWNSSPDPPLTPAKHKRASLSLPPTTDIFAVDDKSDSDTRRPMIQRVASGDDSDGGTPSTPTSVYLRVNRRRTDLMPTIPSPRDGPPSTARSSSVKAFTRSPGRTYSMSRLDQLAQPRKRTTEQQLGTLAEQQQSQPLQSASSMSRSMSHLAAPGGAKSLKRSDNSRSMGTLPGAAPMPRPTRAERLRRKAREYQQTQQQQGIRSGEVTPNSPSRPHSSMSQQSASSVGSSNVNLRTRTAASRRPRPASIAGTGVSVTEKHNLVDTKLTKDSKPPLPKVHSTPKKPSIPKVAEVRKPTEKLIKNAKSSPRITPKATPLQSPGAEHAPLIRETNVEIIKQDENKETQNVKSEDKNEEKKDQGSEKTQEANIVESITNDTKIGTEPVSASKQVKDETNLMQENLSGAIAEEPSKIAKKEENKQEKKSPEMTEIKLEAEMDEQVDMSASMIAKIRITTEEEAKAALAERRRLAREQAEREAELERQRQEEEARIEAERLRAEEEEQRRLEEETIRLANEAREAEEQRLQLAIEEAKRREEEDRRKREEEARQKQEKEEAERKAREEAEKQRIEMAERLKKEEEERNARRKRVEAIMLRTRGKNQTNTSTKGEGGDGDKLKEDSPTDENKPMPDGKGDDVMTASLISEATQQFISGEQRAHHTENSVPAPDIVHNGTTHSNGINENKIVLDNNQGNVEGELNGHHTNHGNSINSQSITLDNATVKQNNVTNNLLDLSDFDTLSNNSTGYDTGPILELTPNLANEDTLNSNLNPAAMPFTPMGFVPAATNANVNPFQDNFINKPQDNNQVPDLLS